MNMNNEQNLTHFSLRQQHWAFNWKPVSVSREKFNSFIPGWARVSNSLTRRITMWLSMIWFRNITLHQFSSSLKPDDVKYNKNWRSWFPLLLLFLILTTFIDINLVCPSVRSQRIIINSCHKFLFSTTFNIKQNFIITELEIPDGLCCE